MANFFDTLYNKPYRSAGSALSDGWGSVWDWLSGKTANELNYETSSKLMALQNEYNVNNWRTQQSQGPSLYRQGLENAGFNPILAVGGSSSVPTGTIAPVSSSAGGSARSGTIGDIVSMFSWVTSAVKSIQEIANLKTQQQNISSDTNLKIAETEKVRKESDSIDPKINRQNAAMGTGFVGDLQKLGRNIVNALGFDYDDTLGDYGVSGSSAKSTSSEPQKSSHSAVSTSPGATRRSRAHRTSKPSAFKRLLTDPIRSPLR